MSGTVDSRIVSMKFDNQQFQQGVSQTLGSLDKLKQSLNFTGAAKGLDGVQSAINHVSFGSITGGIDGVSKGFLSMATIGVTALADITKKAVDTGVRVVKALTITPVLGGFQEYEAGLSSFQTIIANTHVPVAQANAALAELNNYANLTIYSFGDMTKAVGLFTAQGVNLKDSLTGIKGIYNLVALTGGSADQANSAIYQLSQAIAAGTVRAQDWISVVNAGIGGKDFQNQLIQTAKVHGVAVDAMIKKEGSFRASLQDGWLSSSILLETLQQYTGDLSAQQLKAKGYSEAQIKEIQALGALANQSATRIKTASQLLDTIKSNVVTNWATSFKTVIGSLDTAAVLWTNVGNAIGNTIQVSADARNKMLKDWAALGGRTLLIYGLTNVFKALGDVIKPIKEAFRELFPAETAKTLYQATHTFAKFTESLIPTKKTIDEIKRTFAGFFAIFDILKRVLEGAGNEFISLIKSTGLGSGGFLAFTARIGDFLVSLDAMLIRSHGVTKFFINLGLLIGDAIRFFKDIADKVKIAGNKITDFFNSYSGYFSGAISIMKSFIGYLSHLFDGFSVHPAQVIEDNLGRINDRLATFKGLGHDIAKAWADTVTLFSKLGKYIKPAINDLTKAFQGLGHAFAESLKNGNFNEVLDAINTGLFGVIIGYIHHFLKNVGSTNFGGGFLNILNNLGSTLKSLELEIKAKALEQIAIALGLLVISLVALSLIDSAKLTKALAAMGTVFTELVAGMAAIAKIGDAETSIIKVSAIAASMILVAAAIDILVIAVKELSGLSWEQLAKGLGGVVVLLGSLAGTAQLLSLNSEGLAAAGLGMIGIATAIKILVSAIKDFSQLSWQDIGKGLAGVAGSLLAIAGAMQLMPPTMLANGAALILIGAALKIIASAVKQMSGLDYKTMLRGLVGVAGALGIIAGAMQLMPPTMLANAAALNLVGSALLIIGKAVKNMGSMDWKTIGKGLTTLAGALGILAAALLVMDGTLPGSAALLVASGALAVLAPVMKELGSLSWLAIAKGMVVLAGAFTILGVAGLVLTPLIPEIVGLGVALLATGAGLALAGVGALAFATALTIVAAVGAAGATALGVALGVIIQAIPSAIGAFGEGLVEFAAAIAKGAPTVINSLVTIINGLLDAVAKIAPHLGDAISTLIQTVLKVINDNAPEIIQAGLVLLENLLTGIKNNLPQLLDTAGDIVAALIVGLANQDIKIVNAAFAALITFMNGFGLAIKQNAQQLGQAGQTLAEDIIEGVVIGLGSLVGINKVAAAAKKLGKTAIDSLGKIVGWGSPAKVFIGIGKDTASGFAIGIQQFSNVAGQAAADMGNLAIISTANAIGAHSPAVQFIKLGQYVNDGFAKGIIGGLDNTQKALDTLSGLITDSVTATQNDVQTASDKLDSLLAAKKPNTDAINKARTALKEALTLHGQSVDAQNALTNAMKTQQAQLLQLGSQYDTVTSKLKDAQSALDAATKTRDDAAASIASQYGALPDIAADTSLGSYEDTLRKQISDTSTFKATLDKLRELGLNDTAYNKLLGEGVGIQPFINQLLADGPQAVHGFDDLTDQLITASQSLGTDAASSLYQAGVDSAQGLVNGLTSQQTSIQKQMNTIGQAMIQGINNQIKAGIPTLQAEMTGLAAAMVAQIKKELKIKSPSQVTADIGKQLVLGLAGGVDAYSSIAEDSATNLANSAVSALKSTMSSLSDSFSSAVNVNPVISPVLDLSQVRKDAAQIGGIVNSKSLAASISYGQAMSISATSTAQQPTTTVEQPTPVTPSGTVIEYTQNNYSPKALSPVDIYRATKSQLALAKEATN